MNDKMAYFVTTSNPRRLSVWESLFGTTHLPIIHPSPRFQWIGTRQYATPAYDLDISRLTQNQINKLAAYIAKRQHRDYATVLREVADGWPIPALQTEVTAHPHIQDETAHPQVINTVC